MKQHLSVPSCSPSTVGSRWTRSMSDRRGISTVFMTARPRDYWILPYDQECSPALLESSGHVSASPVQLLVRGVHSIATMEYR